MRDVYHDKLCVLIGPGCLSFSTNLHKTRDSSLKLHQIFDKLIEKKVFGAWQLEKPQPETWLKLMSDFKITAQNVTPKVSYKRETSFWLSGIRTIMFFFFFFLCVILND